MPVVNGKLTRPDLVEQAGTSCSIELVDQFGASVRGFKSTTNETIYGPGTVPLTAGAYSVTLPDNAAITPANTMYKRTFYLPGGVTEIDYYVVPTGGGPYQEAALALNVTPLPLPPASNEVASVEFGTTSGNLAVNGFNLVPCPSFVITIPDLTRPCILLGNVTVNHSVANAGVVAGIAAVGETAIGNAVGYGVQRAATATQQVTCNFVGRLAAHSAGSYQVVVNTTDTGGNMTVIGGTNRISIVEALAV